MPARPAGLHWLCHLACDDRAGRRRLGAAPCHCQYPTSGCPGAIAATRYPALDQQKSAALGLIDHNVAGTGRDSAGRCGLQRRVGCGMIARVGKQPSFGPGACEGFSQGGALGPGATDQYAQTVQVSGLSCDLTAIDLRQDTVGAFFQQVFRQGACPGPRRRPGALRPGLPHAVADCHRARPRGRAGRCSSPCSSAKAAIGTWQPPSRRLFRALSVVYPSVASTA